MLYIKSSQALCLCQSVLCGCDFVSVSIISSVLLSKMSEKVKGGKTFWLLGSRAPVCGWLALRILGSGEAAWWKAMVGESYSAHDIFESKSESESSWDKIHLSKERTQLPASSNQAHHPNNLFSKSHQLIIFQSRLNRATSWASDLQHRRLWETHLNKSNHKLVGLFPSIFTQSSPNHHLSYLMMSEICTTVSQLPLWPATETQSVRSRILILE